MDVSIIIVNYNTVSFLVGAIDSILAKTKNIEYEIIVVDNNSNDDSRTILSEKYDNKVIYLGLSENIGFGRANNEAAKIAKGRNLFFLNPDTVLLNNAVKILSDYLDNNHCVGCCGGNLVDVNNKPNISYLRVNIFSVFYELNEICFKLLSKMKFGKNCYYNHTNKPMKVKCIIGADLMIRKEIFVKLYGFDPDFFMYHEESELESRVIKMGYEIYNIPYAKIIHYEGKSFNNNKDKIRYDYLSRNMYIHKTYNKTIIIIINILYFIRIKIRLFIFIILRNKEKITLWSEINKQKIYYLSKIYN